MVCVLICDDDAPLAEELRLRVKACFASRDIAARIRICNSGAELLNLLNEAPPDLVFLDLSLRDADGSARDSRWMSTLWALLSK